MRYVSAQVMAERGVSLAGHRPALLTQELADWADRVITMGCAIDESCPAALGPVEDWGLADPSGQPAAVVRGIRDQIEARVRALLHALHD